MNPARESISWRRHLIYLSPSAIRLIHRDGMPALSILGSGWARHKTQPQAPAPEQATTHDGCPQPLDTPVSRLIAPPSDEKVLLIGLANSEETLRLGLEPIAFVRHSQWSDTYNTCAHTFCLH